MIYVSLGWEGGGGGAERERGRGGGGVVRMYLRGNAYEVLDELHEMASEGELSGYHGLFLGWEKDHIVA